MLAHLTGPRVSTIQSFFQTRSVTDTFGCYAWNQAVGAGLLPVIGDFEVAFRNALHRALSQYFANVDSFDWMMPRPNPAHAVNPAAPAALPPRHKMSPRSVSDVERAIDKIKDQKPPGHVVTPDDVVAALPFGFWEVLVDSLGWKGHPMGMREAVLGSVFPHAPDLVGVPYGDPGFRKRVKGLLKRIRDVRNRIGHHDALWTMPEFDEYGHVGFVPRRPRHTVNSLRLFAGRVCWFAGWIDPAIPDYIHRSDHWYTLLLMLERRALVAYRLSGGEAGAFRTVMRETDPAYASSVLSKKPLHRFHERQTMSSYFF